MTEISTINSKRLHKMKSRLNRCCKLTEHYNDIICRQFNFFGVRWKKCHVDIHYQTHLKDNNVNKNSIKSHYVQLQV